MKTYDMPTGPVLDSMGRLSPAWAVFFTRTHMSARALQDSGPTSQRPTAQLWVGRPYFDTTLNIPVWVQSVPPRPTPAVWVDATGAPV